MKKRQIRTTAHRVSSKQTMQLGGWLDGPNTYLWFGDANGNCIGHLDGGKLLRLAKAIVRQMEG